MARYRAALAPDEILDLASILAGLDKVRRWVDTDERQLGNELAHVLVVVLYGLETVQTAVQWTYFVAIDLKVNCHEGQYRERRRYAGTGHTWCRCRTITSCTTCRHTSGPL